MEMSLFSQYFLAKHSPIPRGDKENQGNESQMTEKALKISGGDDWSERNKLLRHRHIPGEV